MHLSRSWPWALLVLLLFCVPLFIGLGRTDLGNDEAIYSFAVDKILETGDWLTPKTSPRVDIAFLEKPPLKFWIVAAPIRFGLLPHDEFGLRFWDAVMGGVAFLYVFALGVRIAGPVCGFIAVLLLFVHSPLLFIHGLRSNNMEAPLVLSYCGGVYHYLAWASAGHDRRRATGHVAAIAAFFVLGFMTKFVAVVFLPLVLLVAAVLYREERVRLWRERWIWLAAAVAVLAITAPWFVYQYRQFGPAVWKIMMGAHVVTRFTSYLDPSHLQPWHFYFSELYAWMSVGQSLALAIPGVILFAWHVATARQRDDVLIVLWFVVPVTLISFGSSKLYHYVYPFLPPVALAGGYFAQRVVDLLPGWLRGPASNFDRALPGALGAPGSWLARPTVRVVLLSLAAVSVGVAIWTLVRRGVHIRVGGVNLLRNASSTRPLVYALVFAALGGQMRRASYVAAPLLLLWLAPLEPYGQALTQARTPEHPMRTTRNCLLDLRAREGAAAGAGMYVDVPGDRLHHFHHYYFDPIGPWERAEQPSDPDLFARLYIAGKQKPVLVWEERYQKLVTRLQHHDRALFEEVARAESLPLERIEDIAEHASSPMVTLRDVLVVLPGPYGRCGR